MAKERPRTFAHKKTGRIITFTPDKTRAYEEVVRLFAHRARLLAQWPEPTSEDRFSVSIELRLGELTGDVDNYAKAILDGLQPIVFRKDLHVCSLDVSRILRHPSPSARVEVRRVRERIAARPDSVARPERAGPPHGPLSSGGRVGSRSGAP